MTCSLWKINVTCLKQLQPVSSVTLNVKFYKKKTWALIFASTLQRPENILWTLLHIKLHTKLWMQNTTRLLLNLYNNILPLATAIVI